jgi:hypothetical protein
MPLPTVLSLAIASGLAAALAGKAELRVSPRPALLTQTFLAWLSFAALVLVPVSIYFYAFHGDWFVLYLMDVRRIPSALAMLGFAVEVILGAGGFALGAALVRAQRDSLGVAAVLLFLIAAGAVVPAAPDRLAMVGTFTQWRGNFGLVPYGEGTHMQGTLAMTGLLLLGGGFMLVRLWVGSRKA